MAAAVSWPSGLSYPSADNADGGSSSLPDIEGGNLQLDLFSSRSYEWWEAGNKLNAKNTIQKSSEEQHFQEDVDNKPYEDEFSQEIFYEDTYQDACED